MNHNIALLLIDVQNGFNDPYWGSRNNPLAERNMKLLLHAFRVAKQPIIHVQHLSRSLSSPLHPNNQAGIEFMDFAVPVDGELVFTKNVNSAFIGTKLEDALHASQIQALFIAGISTDHCVSTTSRMASNLGFKVYVIADASIAFDRTGFDGVHYSADVVHAVSLASLHHEFATVINTKTAVVLIDETMVTKEKAHDSG